MIENTPDGWDTLAAAATPWEAAMWSQHGQTERFIAVRALLGPLLREEDVVFDFGCGTARFSEFLPSSVEYVGFDWSPAMRSRAREDHPDAIVVDTLEGTSTFDHVVAIGPFNLRDGWSVKRTINQVELLWALADMSLTLSLFTGASSPAMLSYSFEDISDMASMLDDRPGVLITNQHLPNDVLVRFVRR